MELVLTSAGGSLLLDSGNGIVGLASEVDTHWEAFGLLSRYRYFSMSPAHSEVEYSSTNEPQMQRPQ